jgi:hypothetical protein
MKSYRRFPRDEEFQREIQNRDLYNFRSRTYFLRRLENHNRKERVTVNDYTIEHIMPQSEDLPRHWREELGPEWERIHQTWLHTLGNLTLTGYNSEYSNRSFAEKRSMPGGFAESPLRLNAGIGQVQQWNEEAIKSRAERLAELAAEVWKMPDLPVTGAESRAGSESDGSQVVRTMMARAVFFFARCGGRDSFGHGRINTRCRGSGPL